jgi:predicted DNA-binding transcriptional regulator YafY
VDRMAGIRATGHTFRPRRLDDPAAFVNQSIAVAPYLHQATVRVAASAQAVVQEVSPDSGVVTAEGPDACLLELGAESLEWLAGYLVGLGVDFEVLDPPELRLYLARLGIRLTRAHQARKPGAATPPRSSRRAE